LSKVGALHLVKEFTEILCFEYFFILRMTLFYNTWFRFTFIEGQNFTEVTDLRKQHGSFFVVVEKVSSNAAIPGILRKSSHAC
jgi:hypothetical protein